MNKKKKKAGEDMKKFLQNIPYGRFVILSVNGSGHKYFKDAIDEDLSLSSYLSKHIAKNYSQVSKTFSAIEGQTIERFFINLKIEKATEMISYDDKNFSQIAFYLGYKNLQHLSRQFKQVTGMTMTEYKALQNSTRKGIDKVWSS